MTTSEKLRVAHALDELGVDVIEAGLPDQFPRRFPGGAQYRQGGAPAGHRRALPGPAGGHRAGSRGRRRCGARPDPHLHRHLARAPRAKAGDLRGRVCGAGRRGRGACPELHGRRGVQRGGCDPDGPALPLQDRRRCRGGRATTINIPTRSATRSPARSPESSAPWSRRGSRNGPRGPFHALPQRPRFRHRQLPRRVEAGARQVECTVNGIGERAGNAALEEIVMAIAVRKDILGFETGIHTHRIHPTSRLLSKITGIHPQPNKAIVGRNAFAHEAGIHQDGMLKERSTYEIMDPPWSGSREPARAGEALGSACARVRFQELGYELAGRTWSGLPPLQAPGRPEEGDPGRGPHRHRPPRGHARHPDVLRSSG
jgi:2-isopropylmalate synthase